MEDPYARVLYGAERVRNQRFPTSQSTSRLQSHQGKLSNKIRIKDRGFSSGKKCWNFFFCNNNLLLKIYFVILKKIFK